jgi:hypothetical protein
MMARDDDMAKLTASLKKLNDDSKRENIEKLKKSSSEADRKLGETFERDLKNDTSTMQSTREGYGRRIGADGKPTGPELKKMDNGSYQEVKEVKDKKKFASGGLVMNKGIGASMKPHNVFGSKGKK